MARQTREGRRISDELLTFYDFPTAHWMHLRTTNVVRSK